MLRGKNRKMASFEVSLIEGTVTFLWANFILLKILNIPIGWNCPSYYLSSGKGTERVEKTLETGGKSGTNSTGSHNVGGQFISAIETCVWNQPLWVKNVCIDPAHLCINFITVILRLSQPGKWLQRKRLRFWYENEWIWKGRCCRHIHLSYSAQQLRCVSTTLFHVLIPSPSLARLHTKITSLPELFLLSLGL